MTNENDVKTTPVTLVPGKEVDRGTLSVTRDDVIAQQERSAFEAYVRNQGEKIPSNFKDAGSWFDSLKEAQKNFTQTKQEMAALKQQYDTNPNNPDYKEPLAEPAGVANVASSAPTVPEEPVLDLKDTLKIPKNEPKPVEKPSSDPTVSEADWKQWTVEFATSGELSADTKALIAKKTKLPDFVINEYMLGQKAKIEMAYNKAGSIVGGKDNLAKIFTWASKNLAQAEQDVVNASLATAGWETTLLGLNAKFERATGSRKTAEPKQATQQVALSNANVPVQSYKTKREFAFERNDPRFVVDPKYRAAVEQRMLLTDFNKLQA